jgi:hypothetical protein
LGGQRQRTSFWGLLPPFFWRRRSGQREDGKDLFPQPGKEAALEGAKPKRPQIIRQCHVLAGRAGNIQLPSRCPQARRGLMDEFKASVWVVHQPLVVLFGPVLKKCKCNICADFSFSVFVGDGLFPVGLLTY